MLTSSDLYKSTSSSWSNRPWELDDNEKVVLGIVQDSVAATFSSQITIACAPTVHFGLTVMT